MRRPFIKAAIATLALAGTVWAGSPTTSEARPHMARPYNITSVTSGNTCWYVEFDDGSAACVDRTAFNTDDDPYVGPIDSFWHSYIDTSFPFFHQGGMTQPGVRGIEYHDQ